ncbi:calmodulin [Ascoidea rubescens DSM 1968]|uniref:Calmodulin n=1 Tax=Ascoidea rubescens DSM 1968 TaxID=1344418 RepID=A0A1D2VCN3_9ASCO|nr:calmodulin [Ascoidea rubescens DSM 1968]ODV59401.1 calmodulin [Ascoidea rubescens DSM 1968]
MADKLSEKQITEFQEAFSLFDTNNDGKITRKELGTVIRSLGQNLTEKDLNLMINELNISATENNIDFPEFLTIMAKQATTNNNADNDQLEIQFNAHIDHFFSTFANANNKISIKDLKHVLSSIGETLTIEEIDQILLDSELKNAKEVDYNQFKELLVVA